MSIGKRNYRQKKIELFIWAYPRACHTFILWHTIGTNSGGELAIPLNLKMYKDETKTMTAICPHGLFNPLPQLFLQLPPTPYLIPPVFLSLPSLP